MTILEVQRGLSFPNFIRLYFHAFSKHELNQIGKIKLLLCAARLPLTVKTFFFFLQFKLGAEVSVGRGTGCQQGMAGHWFQKFFEWIKNV